jgi:5-hydroxyisourate hydrolase-like protein (transthyretin family)
MHKYAIGFYTGDTANDVLNALGVEGTYKADDTQALQNALDEILQIYTSQIVNGIITDPMSVAVAKKGSFTQSALLLKSGNLTVLQAGDQNYPQYAKDVKVEEDGERIVLSNVTLGRTDAGQEGLRITYLVELKNDYRNGDFYQTNDTTMLENFDGNYLHFAIPSVRDVPKKTSLTVKKQWVDENNRFDTQQELVMELYSRKTGTDDEWKLVNTETFAKGVTSHEFTDLIVAIGTTKMEYKVVEKIGNEVTNVYGYAMPTYGMQPITLSLTQPNQLTVKNELRYAQYEFTKVAGDGKTPLKDVSFTITRKGSNEAMNTVVSDQNGKVAFSSLPVGDYTVKEVVAPDGHQIADEFTIAVQDVGADKDLLVESTLKGHTLVNSLKPTELTVTKVDSITGNPLEGATFDLYQVAEEKNELIGTATSTEEGIVKFTKGLTPGDYKLVETGAPTGYMLMQGDFTFTITQLGKVMNFEYTGSDMDNAQTPTLHLTSGEALNQLSITAKNQAAPVVPLPLTGGTGLQIILIIGGLLIGIAGWLKLNDWRKHRGGDGDA